MKKYIYILSLGLFFGLSSCDDRLDLEPFDQVDSGAALVTPNDFENGVRNLYVVMRREAYYSGGIISFADVASDNLTFNPSGRGTQRSTHQFQVNANDTRLGFYVACYDVIQQANFILENVNRLPDGAFKDNIIGEAKAARALAHFDANKVFSKIPTQSADANASPGLPYLFASDINQLPGRITVGAFYDFLVTDLTDAVALINSSNGAGRFNLNAVNALLSRVYLYRGDWQAAADAADLVTTSVASRANFTGIWNDSNDSEVIFEIKLIQQNPEFPGTAFNQNLNGEIRSEYVVSYPLFSLYLDTDIRKTAYTLTGPYVGNDYNHVIKYATSSVNIASGRVDVKVLRAAEVQLNKAEALANLDQDANALLALNLVRANRYTGFISGNETGPALKAEIQLQRRLELAFEGHRFFDIKRTGASVERGSFGEYADGTGVPSIGLLLPAGDCRFQFPIPKAEIDLNPNMTQNDCSFY